MDLVEAILTLRCSIDCSGILSSCLFFCQGSGSSSSCNKQFSPPFASPEPRGGVSPLWSYQGRRFGMACFSTLRWRASRAQVVPEQVSESAFRVHLKAELLKDSSYWQFMGYGQCLCCWWVCVCVCLFFFVFLFDCLFVCLFVYGCLFVCLFFCLFVCFSFVCVLLCVALYCLVLPCLACFFLPSCLCVCLSVCLSVCLFVCLLLWQLITAT